VGVAYKKKQEKSVDVASYSKNTTQLSMKSSTLLFCAFAIAAVKAQSTSFFTTNNACAGGKN
jgi:hypothetical protein